MLKKLPIGIQTLSEILTNNFLYVDKTPFVVKMAQQKYFFLSRPRRFGKSLLLDTIKQAFLGNKHLFENLYLYDKWDWSQTYPVIHIDFGKNEKSYEIDTLKEKIHTLLAQNAAHYDLLLRGRLYSDQFDNLIQDLHAKTGKRVVILIDEYDKPILDAITDTKIAQDIRDVLRSFYSCIKSNDAFVRFCLLTGVTKFSKVSLFSGLNNLQDITISQNYADCCGYTQVELEHTFAPYLTGIDMNKLKQWYNGYNFGGSQDQKVYNPFDILLFFDNNNQFRPFWFETGTPSFLIALLSKQSFTFSQLESFSIALTDLSTFDVDVIHLPSLMFQSGYLTLQTITEVMGVHYASLVFPNFEVKQSFYHCILQHILQPNQEPSITQRLLQTIVLHSHFEQLQPTLNAFFASIPHDWYRNNPMGQYEGFYASILYALFSAIGAITFPEDTTSTGQMDMSIVLPDKILILEFKCTQSKTLSPSNPALEQILSKHYAQKFTHLNKPIYAVGILFNTNAKTIQQLDWESVSRMSID